MRLRYAGVCHVCSEELAAGTSAVYRKSTRTVRCLGHDQALTVVDPAPATACAEIDAGTAGASARREHEKRRTRREARVRARHPRIGGLLLAVTDDPQSTKAWETGALGEERLGGRLDEQASPTLLLLHDRRIPRTRANIDHLAVTPSGVWVIDAKRYAGRPTQRIEGGLIRERTEKLLVAGRDRTNLVDGVLKQIDLVAGIVPDDVPVRGVLCFIEADWPLVGGDFRIRGVDVTWPKRMYRTLRREGPLDSDRIAEMHRLLAETLPPA